MGFLLFFLYFVALFCSLLLVTVTIAEIVNTKTGANLSGNERNVAKLKIALIIIASIAWSLIIVI